MDLDEFAKLYTRKHDLSGKRYSYAATRFRKACGPLEVEDLTADLLDQYRDWCRSQGLRPATIEGSIKELLTLRFDATGVRLDPGRKIRVPRPIPEMPGLDQIAAVYQKAPDWLQQYLALSYWTCLRIADCLRYQRRLDGPVDVLRWTASKTGHSQTWPVPSWLQRHLRGKTRIPRGKEDNHLKRVLRRELQVAAKSAGVPYFTPQQLRRKGLTEWARANAMAGAIDHGSGLGVLDHYVDPLTVLESAAPRVRLPAGFAKEEEREELASFPDLLKRLDPEARALVLATAQRLAT